MCETSGLFPRFEFEIFVATFHHLVKRNVGLAENNLIANLDNQLATHMFIALLSGQTMEMNLDRRMKIKTLIVWARNCMLNALYVFVCNRLHTCHKLNVVANTRLLSYWKINSQMLCNNTRQCLEMAFQVDVWLYSSIFVC